MNNQNQRSTFSNYGNSLVTVAAPGEGVISTYPGRLSCAAGWGTSFSAPLVAGGAALLVQTNPNAGVQSIVNALQNGAIGVGQDWERGWCQSALQHHRFSRFSLNGCRQTTLQSSEEGAARQGLAIVTSGGERLAIAPSARGPNSRPHG